jgi:hypothetical protein
MPEPVSRDPLVLHLQRDLREMAKADPYSVYWRCADEIAAPDSIDREILRSGMVELADPRRLRYLAWRAVDRGALNGNTATPTELVLLAVEQRSACGRHAAIQAIQELIEMEVLIPYRDRSNRSWVYLAQLATAEDLVAQFARERLCQR